MNKVAVGESAAGLPPFKENQFVVLDKDLVILYHEHGYNVVLDIAQTGKTTLLAIF